MQFAFPTQTCALENIALKSDVIMFRAARSAGAKSADPCGRFVSVILSALSVADHVVDLSQPFGRQPLYLFTMFGIFGGGVTY